MPTRSVLTFFAGSVFAAGFLVFCGPPHTPLAKADPPDAGSALADAGSALANQSGSRLRAKVYKGTDGSAQFLNMYDSQLQTNCGWQAMSDGTTRCLPQGPEVSAPTGSQPSTVYLDSACTMPIYRQPGAVPGCPTPAVPKYLSVLRNVAADGGCSSTSYQDFYTLSQTAVAPPALYALSILTGACVNDACLSSGCGLAYPASGQMVPSEFVEGTMAVE